MRPRGWANEALSSTGRKPGSTQSPKLGSCKSSRERVPLTGDLGAPLAARRVHRALSLPQVVSTPRRDRDAPPCLCAPGLLLPQAPRAATVSLKAVLLAPAPSSACLPLPEQLVHTHEGSLSAGLQPPEGQQQTPGLLSMGAALPQGDCGFWVHRLLCSHASPCRAMGRGRRTANWRR